MSCGYHMENYLTLHWKEIYSSLIVVEKFEKKNKNKKIGLDFIDFLNSIWSGCLLNIPSDILWNNCIICRMNEWTWTVIMVKWPGTSLLSAWWSINDYLRDKILSLFKMVFHVHFRPTPWLHRSWQRSIKMWLHTFRKYR